ncbi:Putative DASH complex subunit Dad2 protein [Septoria linicola]|uniref:DASH complex subunit DAD2 n=1 Tax=Septoria linicola TaxID=215465 RepID=A0A9Q9B6P3_9PEZI|nr:putative DASH complex subunit Dad2 protein [Septoria linicola]USW58347.1 Putative DASH complex subunit Dad2 protein [Septoria linicola]
MSYAPRPTSGMMRPSSGLGGHHSTNSQSSVLQSRINEKKLELESLKQLRDLSAGLAGQMQQLEEKLGTLSNGTEAVAAVMANWNTVLRAIHMASAAIPKPKADGDEQQAEEEAKPQLPSTLVRIPIEQAEDAKKQLQESQTGD